jgi:hypothetical protein
MSISRSPSVIDRFASARAVADAVLYEGYVLYPYRASSRKNQLRWQFGVLAPQSVAADGSERASMRTEVIVDAGSEAALTVRLRFLQVQRRTLESSVGDGFVSVDSLIVDSTHVTPWEEAVEHEVELEPIMLLPIPPGPIEVAIDLPARDEEILVHASSGELVGRTIHHREHVSGLVRVTVGWADGDAALVKVSVEVENTTEWSRPPVAADHISGGQIDGGQIDGGQIDGGGSGRDVVMLRSLVAVHTLLAIDDSAFVSLLDPPEFASAAVGGCHNDGTFPVLAGAAGSADVMLSSPIILYDHPSVAPESAGDFCDATEIDEILALRVLTLTDDEKAEARGTDPRAAAIIDRCDDMPPEMWERLHGAIRSLEPMTSLSTAVPGDTDGEQVPWWDPGADASVDPWTDSIIIAGVEVAAGTRVRLHPSHRADAQDLFYVDKVAIVKGVFRDVDSDTHVAVALEDDPVADEFEWQGRFLYFHPDEIEVLA